MPEKRRKRRAEFLKLINEEEKKELRKNIYDIHELKQFVGAGHVIDRSGHSAAKVFETQNGYYIKCEAPGALALEYQMTKIFYQLGFGPEAVQYITLDRDYMVTRKMPGENLTRDLQDPLRICRVLADALRRLHSQPIRSSIHSSIPVSGRYVRYMESAEGTLDGASYDPSVYTGEYRLSSRKEAWEVMQRGKHLLCLDTLIHGDACLPNILQKNGTFCSFVDVSMGGIGDRHIDLYWAIWSLQYNLKTSAYTDAFLDYYGRNNFSKDMFKVIAACEAFG